VEEEDEGRRGRNEEKYTIKRERIRAIRNLFSPSLELTFPFRKGKRESKLSLSLVVVYLSLAANPLSLRPPPTSQADIFFGLT